MEVMEDITQNLSSLQFESALHGDEKALLYLRSRSVAVISSACGQGAYFVNILNEARKKLFEKPMPHCKFSNYNPLKIGIIGCGRLGKQLASAFLEFGGVDPCDLYISTRCPEDLDQFKSRGVVCCFDNQMVCSTVDVLFLCCLPSQLHTVSKDLRGNLRCSVYSFIGGMSLAKISQLLDYQKIIKPNFIFKPLDHDRTESNPWQFGRSIIEVLHDPICCAQTCPFNSDDESLLEDDEKLFDIFVYSFLNECTVQGITKCEALRLCNSVLFGLETNHSSGLTMEDILLDSITTGNEASSENDNVFPVFNLAKVSCEESLLGKKLYQEDGLLKKAFVTRYRKVFENFRWLAWEVENALQCSFQESSSGKKRRRYPCC